MTLKKLNELCKKYNINEDVKLMSDSGWECYDPVYIEQGHPRVTFLFFLLLDVLHPKYIVDFIL